MPELASIKKSTQQKCLYFGYSATAFFVFDASVIIIIHAFNVAFHMGHWCYRSSSDRKNNVLKSASFVQL